MTVLILAAPLEGLVGLAPLFVVPIAAFIGAWSIPAMKYLYKRPGRGKEFILLLLGVLNLVAGLILLSATHDATTRVDDAYRQHWWIMVDLAYLCSGIMAVCGGYAIWKLGYRIYKRKDVNNG